MLLLNVFQVSVWSTDHIRTILTISLSHLIFPSLSSIDVKKLITMSQSPK